MRRESRDRILRRPRQCAGVQTILGLGLISSVVACGEVNPNVRQDTSWVDSALVDARADANADSATPEAGIQMPASPCDDPYVVPCDFTPSEHWKTFAAASSFGDVTFVAQSWLNWSQDSLVLGARHTQDATDPVVIARSFNASAVDWAVFRPDYDAQDLSPVDLAAFYGTRIDPDGRIMCEAGLAFCAHVLACDAVGCSLLGVPRGEPPGYPGIVRVPGGAVPAMRDVKGVREKEEIVDGSVLRTTCVFGDGVYCFDGHDWTQVGDASALPTLNDLQAVPEPDASQVLIGVADQGQLLVAQGPFGQGTEWQAVDTGIEDDLLAVAVSYVRRVVAVGRSGSIVVGWPDDVIAYRLGLSDLVAVTDFAQAYYPYGVRFAALSSSGCVFHAIFDYDVGWPPQALALGCRLEGALVGDVRGVSFGPCLGSSAYLALLSGEYLAGPYDEYCGETP